MTTAPPAASDQVGFGPVHPCHVRRPRRGLVVALYEDRACDQDREDHHLVRAQE